MSLYKSFTEITHYKVIYLIDDVFLCRLITKYSRSINEVTSSIVNYNCYDNIINYRHQIVETE